MELEEVVTGYDVQVYSGHINERLLVLLVYMELTTYIEVLGERETRRKVPAPAR